MSLILCGLPGSGKSTVGKLLAQALGRDYLETDQALELYFQETTGEKASCRQIYKKIGDKTFRDLEKKILLSLNLSNSIIDLGGGTLTSTENAKIVKSLGTLYYLKNDRQVIFNRLIQKGLPAYLNANDPYASFVELALKREPLYETYADVTLECLDLAPQEIVSIILNLTGERRRS